MADLDTLEVNKAVAATTVRSVTQATAVALRVRCTDDTVSTGTVSVAATAVALITDVDASTYSFNTDLTYTTLGLLADAINATPKWEAVIIDGVRSISITGTMSLASTTATAATGTAGIPVAYTNTAGVMAAQIGNTGLDTTKVSAGIKNENGWVNTIQGLNVKATDSRATNAITIYSCVDKTETAIYTETLAATTTLQELAINDIIEQNGLNGGIRARLVAVLAQTADATGGGTLNVVGKSYRVEPLSNTATLASVAK
jgi:hypothetical protein